MPLVAHNSLPTFEKLRRFGLEVIGLEEARRQDIRELHIGLLNMMPDAALSATEYQFINLVGNCNKIAQFYVYPFSIPELQRGPEAEAYIAEHYFRFEDLQQAGLDALIITGANVANPSLDQEPFWNPLIEVVEWADRNVTSVLCSCLATHALVRHHYGIERKPLGYKQWGVYAHRLAAPDHPLVRDINTRFDAPHSRWNDVSRAALEAAGCRVLAHSNEAGVHLATSPDGFRRVYFQGHPEYDFHSLLKEYKREVNRYLAFELETPPVIPENYFVHEAREAADRYLDAATRARDAGDRIPPFPDAEIEPLLDNTWGDTGKAIVNNWLGLVYRLTHADRHRRYMDGVDPHDPLGLDMGSE